MLADDLVIGDSLSVNGACLTVIDIQGETLSFDVIAETLACTTLGELQNGDLVNLEPALRLTDRLSGHVVLGHVDGVGIIQTIVHVKDRLEIAIAVPKELKPYLVPKGSVAIDGVSLTIASLMRDTVRVAIIPHTADVTTMGAKMTGDKVNIEVDIMGKYIEQLVGQSERETFTLDVDLLDKIRLPAWPPRGGEQWN